MHMHPQAAHAIRAARNRSQWGAWATRRYLLNHGVPLSLYTLARVLEAATAAGY